MPRKGHTQKREVLADPIYNSKLVTKLINQIMLDGKKGVAQKIVYGAFAQVEEKTGKKAVDAFEEAMNNIMPVLEVKARRIGGATYQVPVEVRPDRRQALALLVFVWMYLKKSKQGYEISVVGESQETARYAGMNVKGVVLRTMFLSGAVCGIAGMVQATGSDVTLTTAVAGGVGFTAIIVAWLSQLNPPTIFIVTILFSILEKGSGMIDTAFGLSSDCSDVLQGIILFFVLGCELFVRYKFVFRGKGGARA